MNSSVHTFDIGLGVGIYSVLKRADQEIEKLKKATINPKSKYWKPMKKIDMETSKVGISNSYFFFEYFNHYFQQLINTVAEFC